MDPYVEVSLYVPYWPVIHHDVVVSVGDEQKDKGKKEETRQETTIGDGTMMIKLLWRMMTFTMSMMKTQIRLRLV